jgi:hypothetical protein
VLLSAVYPHIVSANTPMKQAFLTISLAAPLALIPSVDAGELFLLGAVPYSYAGGASANGSVVAGYDRSGYWYWTNSPSWVVPLDQSIAPGDGVGGSACITDAGTVMTCSTLVDINGVSKAEATLFSIPSTTYDPAIGSLGTHCDIERDGAWGMNPSGDFVCGLVWNGCTGSGFVWDAATDSIKLMPTKYFYKPTRANDISDDGSVVAGWNDDYTGFRQACTWVKNAEGNYVASVLTQSGLATGVKLSEATAISGNGVWLAGMGRSSLDGGAPWRWSAATGYQSLGAQPVPGVGGATAMNADGTKILCFMGVAAALGEGYIWIQGRGYVALEDYAAEHGVSLPEGVRLALPLGISEDQLTITGTARGFFGTSPFVLDLHSGAPVCTGDLNQDGAVDGADLGILLGDWGQSTASDIDNSGFVDGSDLGLLLGAWGTCP